MNTFKLFFESKQISVNILPKAPGKFIIPGEVLAKIEKIEDEDLKYTRNVEDVRVYAKLLSQKLQGGESTTTIKRGVDRINYTEYLLSFLYRVHRDEDLPEVLRGNWAFRKVNIRVIVPKRVNQEITSLRLGKYVFFENKKASVGNYNLSNLQQYITPTTKLHIDFLVRAGFKPQTVFIVDNFIRKPQDVYITLLKDDKPFVYKRKNTKSADMAQSFLYSENTRKNIYHFEYREKYSDTVDRGLTLYGERYYRTGTDILHRIDGPAVILNKKKLQGTGREFGYYINGKLYNKQEFDVYVNGLNKNELDLMSDLGQTFE